MEFKIGDIVKATTDDNYTITSLENGWIGIVTKVSKHCFSAKTLFCYYSRTTSFENLEYNYFELIDEPLEDVAHKAILNFIDYNKELFKNYDVNFTVKPKPQILDEVEKCYLSAVIRPFRDRVLSITKYKSFSKENIEYINIRFSSIVTGLTHGNISLPYFQAGNMYKGMEVDKQYTLEELGL